jgi:DNA-binding HxlR family transcriptional regulator
MMTKTKVPESSCSIARSLGVLGERWTFLILREALTGATRFSQFRDALGIAPDVLTERLNTLVEYGVMTREPYQEAGSRSRFAYDLTPAGRELQVVLLALQQARASCDNGARPASQCTSGSSTRTGARSSARSWPWSGRAPTRPTAPPRPDGRSRAGGVRLADALAGGRVGHELLRRADRSRCEPAAAVRADPAEAALHAVDAEGALEAADAGELALGRQVAVAALAVGAKLKHRLRMHVRAAGRHCSTWELPARR